MGEPVRAPIVSQPNGSRCCLTGFIPFRYALGCADRESCSHPGGQMDFSKPLFIGTAGKAMSGVALLLRKGGVRIPGSDKAFSPPVSDYLRNENIPFAAG